MLIGDVLLAVLAERSLPAVVQLLIADQQSSIMLRYWGDTQQAVM